MTARRPYGWRPGSSPGWLLRSRNPRIAYVYGISHHDPASWWTTVAVQSIPMGSGGCLRSDICDRSAREQCVPMGWGRSGSNPEVINASYDRGRACVVNTTHAPYSRWQSNGAHTARWGVVGYGSSTVTVHPHVVWEVGGSAR
jgi:hypothetical protein